MHILCERVNAVMKFQLLYLIGKFHDNFAASSSRKTFGLHSTGHMSDNILKSSLQRESGQEWFEKEMIKYFFYPIKFV